MEWFEGDDVIPTVPDAFQDYSVIEDIERRNTSSIVFPDMKKGDGLIHNFTTWHAVALIREGTRYSLILFYDTDNPQVEDFIEKSKHEIVTYNHYEQDVALFFVDYDKVKGEEFLTLVFDSLEEEMKIVTYEGHEFEVFDIKNDKTLGRFQVTIDSNIYEVGFVS